MAKKLKSFIVKKHKWNDKVDYGEQIINNGLQPKLLTLLDKLIDAVNQNDLATFESALQVEYTYPGLVKRKVKHINKGPLQSNETTRIISEYYYWRPVIQALLCIRPSELASFVTKLNLENKLDYLHAIDAKINQLGVPAEAVKGWDESTYNTMKTMLTLLRETREEKNYYFKLPSYKRKSLQHRLFRMPDIADRYIELNEAYYSRCHPNKRRLQR